MNRNSLFCNKVIQYAYRRYFSSGRKSLKGSNHYETLGVSRQCTTKELKEAYVKLCKEHHPDKNPNNPNQHVKFVSLNEAYNILAKAETRHRYDSELNYEQWKPRPYPNRPANSPDQGYEDFDWPMRERYTYQRNHYGAYKKEEVSDRKSFIVLGCLVFMLTGCILHFMFYNLMASISYKRLKEKEVENNRIYSEIRARAKRSTKEEIIAEIFKVDDLRNSPVSEN